MASWRERSVFIKESIRNFTDTGSITPSSRFLAQALTRPLKPGVRKSEPLTVLEAGPGTGSVTERILEMLQPGDKLICYELNFRLYDHLRKRLEPIAAESGVELQILNEPVQNAAIAEDRFDLVISGLPINNFPPDLVESVFQVYFDVVKPGGQISFFEYLGMRKFKTAVSFGKIKARLKGVELVVRESIEPHPYKKEAVWLNFPPAAAHHLEIAK